MILNELLREGNFDIMDIEHKVSLFAPEIDIDAKIKKETHIRGLFHGNCITEDEMRAELGRDPVDDAGRLKLYWTLVDLPKSIILTRDEALAGILISQYEEAQGKNLAGLKIDKKTANLIRPVNQMGPKITSKPAINSSEDIFNNVMYINTRAGIKMLFDKMCMESAAKLVDSTMSVDIEKEIKNTIDTIYLNTASDLKPIYMEGWKIGHKDTEMDIENLNKETLKYQKFLHELGDDATILLKALRTEKSVTYAEVINIFDVIKMSLEKRLPEILESVYKAGTETPTPTMQDKGEN
jgi:hypothetical protein